jgi:3',5'-cyclic AMP phosphodiesterase CpdA
LPSSYYSIAYAVRKNATLGTGSNYDLDGFRVDACGGSREPNWSTNIPYARASLAMMQGGLEMMNGIRAEVRRANPRHGAVLAEVESARQAAVSDVQYDFTFCYTLCRSWNRMEAGPFVDALQDYLEEQRLSEPRGTVRLRHVESHDSLRAQGWYGVQGLRAFYALSAWIDGMPMIYQGMEDGHAFALAEINRVRRERPELSRGGALYRAVHCDVPGVFTCLRKLGDRSSVVVINFNREPVRANLGWPGGKATLALARLEYAVVPESASGPSGPAASERREQGEVAGSELHATLPDETPFVDATEWFVDTIEGRLHDEFPGPRTSGAVGSGGIYWRPQGRGVLWQHALTPLHPDHPLLGFKGRNGLWRVYEFSGEITNPVRLAERGPSGTGLRLLGADGLTARVTKMPQLPPEPDFAADVRRGGVALRCVGSRYIISNAYFRLELRRQGGVLRQLRAGSDVLAENQDFYGDQAYFITQPNARIDASSDVECAVSVRAEVDGFRLRFEGQLRDDGRFALKWPPLWYRNEYVFTSAPRFTKRWAFRTEKAFHSQQAFLSFYVGQVAAERFCFERTGRTLTEGPVVAGSAARQGQTQGPPDAVAFGRSEKPSWSLTGLKVPPVADVHAFLQGHMLFLPLLDGDESSLPDDHWQEFEATWDLPH